MRNKLTIHRKPLIMTELQLISSKLLAATNCISPEVIQLMLSELLEFSVFKEEATVKCLHE